MSITASPNYDITYREINGSIGVFRDVTEEKMAERVLAESEERVRTILSRLQIVIIIVDAETKEITEANPVAADLIGNNRENIIGKSCHDFLCPGDQMYCPLLDPNVEINNWECIMLTSSGEELPILKTVVPLTIGGRHDCITEPLKCAMIPFINPAAIPVCVSCRLRRWLSLLFR